jgi:hypothetical protein
LKKFYLQRRAHQQNDLLSVIQRLRSSFYSILRHASA